MTPCQIPLQGDSALIGAIIRSILAWEFVTNQNITDMEEFEVIETGRMGIMKFIAQVFAMGDTKWLIVIALCLVGVLIAAWKAPKWVSEIGLAAFIIGLLSVAVNFHIGIIGIEQATVQAGDVSPMMLIDGYKRQIIAPICGLLVFLVSQITGMLQNFKR